jgi:hypothetical protein
MEENNTETLDQNITNLDQNQELPPFDYEKLTEEEKERIDEINELIKQEKFDVTTSINIIINAVQVSYDKEHFNDLDRYLIAKSLNSIKELADKGEDIVIKTKA